MRFSTENLPYLENGEREPRLDGKSQGISYGAVGQCDDDGSSNHVSMCSVLTAIFNARFLNISRRISETVGPL